ncbi:MAG: Hsp70 family protein [Alphaproteobacteria bacterium]|nr:Hsp70 family protein [Alphaproteobacteria bacterium]
MSLYLGIDLGTSNSVIAGLLDSKIRIFRPADGGETLPSMIFVDKRGHRLFGRRAHDQAFIAPENVASGFKRLMGSSTTIEIPGADLSLTPEECSAEILRQLIGQVFTEIGEQEIDGVVITIPAAFNQMQSEATLRAAEMAGIKRVALLQEPVAAAMAAMAGTPREGHFLVYDLGGGTFDLALAHSMDGEVKIISHQGINMLGGRDFDRMIVHEVVRPWLKKTYNLPEDFYRNKDYTRLMRIAALAAERAKIDLSLVEETQVFASEEEVRMKDLGNVEIFIDATLTRTVFEGLIKIPVNNTIDLIRTVLEEAELKSEDLETIVFIGGPSRIPLIKEMVAEALKVPVDLKIDPMTAVAIGAAYHAESLTWEAIPAAKTVATETQAPAPGKVQEKLQAKPKPKEARVEVDKKQTGLDLAFDYSARTGADKASVRVVLRAKPAKARWMRAFRDGEDAREDEWQSPLYKLEDGLTLTLPLPNVGKNDFTISVFDEQRDPLPHGDRKISVTRTAASAAQIPAAQTIAVKLMDRKAGANMLEPLIQKGTPLPAEGKAIFRAARDLKAGSQNALALELFQLEYPEKVELNLCIGTFFITGNDLPEGYIIRKGEPVTFNWQMDESGILRSTVLLPAHKDDGKNHDDDNEDPIELITPRFYSPQSAAIAYDAKQGTPFSKAMLRQAEDDWGDLAAAIGPEAGAEIQLLKDRIDDQKEILKDSLDDSEVIRQVSEEARFLRQDIARTSRKHLIPLLQRRMGRLQAIFNRVARSFASAEELERFEKSMLDINSVLDEKREAELDYAERRLEDLTDDFFDLSWRDRNFVRLWFNRLKNESYLFPDIEEFQSMVDAGAAHDRDNDDEALRDLVKRMFDIRVRLAASDTVNEPATLMRGE